jgi:hypothetical protein
MRRYDELIEVRRGLVAGQEAPEQFIWRDRLWVVRDVVSHWVETGAWWDQAGIAALLGVDTAAPATGPGSAAAGRPGRVGTASTGVSAVPLAAPLGIPPATPLGTPLGADLLAESDMWRVEAMDGPRRRRRVMDGLQRRGRGARLNEPPGSAGDKPPDSAEDLDLGYGVFDLAFDWAQARWRLVGCAD